MAKTTYKRKVVKLSAPIRRSYLLQRTLCNLHVTETTNLCIDFLSEVLLPSDIEICLSKLHEVNTPAWKQKFLSLMPNNELVFNPTGLAARLYISDNTFQFLVTDTIEANEFLLQALCFTNSLGHFGIKLSIPQPSNYGDLSDFNSRINTFSMLQIFESILNLIQDPDHVKNGILILSIKDFAINSTLFANIINEVVIATILRVGDSLPCYQRLFTEINELIQIETSSAIKHLLEHITTNKPTVTFSDAIRYTRIAALTVIHHCWAKNPILFYRYDTSLYADRKDVNFRTKEEGLQEDLKS
eukprot:UN00351